VTTCLGAEETQRLKAAPSTVPSSAVKPVVVMDHQSDETKFASSDHRRTGASAAGVARPIRPTQVEPSPADVHASLSLSSAATAKQLKPRHPLAQQHAPLQPSVPNVSQARRLFLMPVNSSCVKCTCHAAVVTV